MNRMEKTVTRSFSVVAGLLMGFLSLLSFCATGVNQTDLAWEKVYMQPDSLLVSLAGLIVSALIAGLVCHVAARWTPWQRRRWVIGVASGLTGLGLLWVLISKTVPQADQWMCCELAKAMNRGDYSSLQPGGYAAMYSHQLGLISWLRVLHVLFGEGMVVAFQIFNVLMIPLLVICGDQLIDEIVKPPLQRQAAGLLLTLFCLFAPMLLYTPFVYGDLSSAALTFLAAVLLLKCLRRFRWRWGIGLALAMASAMALRTNTMIFVIAAGVVLTVRLIGGKRPAVLKTTLCLAAGVLLWRGSLFLLYDRYQTPQSTMPSLLWIAMGTQQSDLGPGWYNAYNLATFRASGWQRQPAQDAAIACLQQFVRQLYADPHAGLRFYLQKIQTQWNVPMVQALAMNNRFAQSPSPLVASVYFKGGRELLDGLMNFVQLAVYAGAAWGLIQDRKKTIPGQLLMITVFGGFLFSLLWEAKARYVLPYQLMLLPYAALGWAMLSDSLGHGIFRKKRILRHDDQSAQQDNPQPQ